MHSLLLAARPKTLPAAIAPVCAGCALAWKFSGVFSLWLAACTLLSTIAIQIATNFFNDAIDFSKGADTSARLGPVRITSSGRMSRRAVLISGGLMVLAAALLALPLISTRGWPILAIGIPGIYFAYGYTGGPLPLAYRGLGDFFVLLFFGLIAVSGTVFVQTGTWPWFGLACGLQIGMLSTVLIAINNLRDLHEDTQSSKRTLAVRWGATFARCEITALCLLPHLVGVLVWPQLEFPSGFWLPLPTIALGVLLALCVWKTEPSCRYNQFLAAAALQLLLFTALFVTACLN
ncbi:MAG: 1,4-dihydroxy-2-naphthoate octaprenyltransferase [Verrucomicrobiales bacterium]|nr:1,4-dihydroxy-2-naphthoate octaprenyltransferase [Verrucomicrobiales bacterium]